MSDDTMTPEQRQKILEMSSKFPETTISTLAALVPCGKNHIEDMIEQKLLIGETRYEDNQYAVTLSVTGFKEMWQKKLEDGQRLVKQAEDALEYIKDNL